MSVLRGVLHHIVCAFIAGVEQAAPPQDAVEQPAAVDDVLLEASAVPDDDDDDDDSVEGLDDFEDILVCSILSQADSPAISISKLIRQRSAVALSPVCHLRTSVCNFI